MASGTSSKQHLHLVLLLEVEVAARKAEAALVVDQAARIDAQQHIVGHGVLLLHVVTIVGGDHLDVVLLGKDQQLLIDVLLADPEAVDIVQPPVPLKFDVVIFAEQVQPPLQFHLRFGYLALHDELRHDGTDTAGGNDQPLVVLHHQFLIDARVLTVGPLDVAQAAELAEVFVALAVLGQHQLVVAVVLFALGAGERLPVPVFHQVKLAAHDRLDLAARRLGHEFKGPEHVTVVGHRHGFLSVSHGLVHHRPDLGGTVEQGILGVAVEVNELGCGHGRNALVR